MAPVSGLVSSGVARWRSGIDDDEEGRDAAAAAAVEAREGLWGGSEGGREGGGQLLCLAEGSCWSHSRAIQEMASLGV